MGVALKLHMDAGQDERVDREIAAMEQIRHLNLANHPLEDTEEPPNARGNLRASETIASEASNPQIARQVQRSLGGYGMIRGHE